MNTENGDKILNHILENQVGFVSELPVVDEDVLERYRKLGFIKIGMASNMERTYNLSLFMKEQVVFEATQTEMKKAMEFLKFLNSLYIANI